MPPSDREVLALAGGAFVLALGLIALGLILDPLRALRRR